jgi:hypothetical protein
VWKGGSSVSRQRECDARTEHFTSTLTVERDLGKRASAQRFPGGLLTRKRSQVQTLSRPPLFSLVSVLTAPSRQHTSPTAAALRPQVAAHEPGRPSSAEPHQTPQPNDHPAWSPLLAQAHGPGTMATTRPGRPAGPVSASSLPSSPATRRHPGAGPAPCRPGGQAAPQPGRGQAAAPAAVNPRASQPRPTPHHPIPPGPVRAGDHPPADHRTRRPTAPNPGAARHTEPSGSSAARTAAASRTLEAWPSGHPDAPDAWTPDTWMHRASARPVGGTSPRRDGRRGQGNDRPGRRPDIPCDRRPPAGRPADLARVTALKERSAIRTAPW